jgi:Amt family ammonium transporter
MTPETNPIDIAWMLMAAAMVMLMQGGFCLLESGLVRAKNSINVAIKNLIDFCLSSAIFWLVGFGIMFGVSRSGVFGVGGFAPSGASGSWLLAFFLFQLTFCGTATTIISGAVAERMHFNGYIAVVVLVSGIFYPIFGHWAWGGVVPGTGTGWLAERGFIDFAGSTVVHSLGGWVSLAAVLLIGPRLGRFSADARPIVGHNLPMSTVGVLLLWFGWFGFNGGSTLGFKESVPLILVNTNLSAVFGGLSALALSRIVHRRPRVEDAMNGVIAGLVGITASCHVMIPATAAVVGAVAGVVCFGAQSLLEKLKVDDAVGAIPAHGFAGTWGTLAVALLGDPEKWGTGLSRWEQLGVQLTGVVVCFAWAFGGALVLLWAINKLIPLRVSAADEQMGLNVSEHGAMTDTWILLMEMEKQRISADISRPVPVEPHTEVGQIAAQYNRVLDRVRHEAAREKAAQEETRRAHREIEELLASISVILIGIDRNGTVLRWNEMAQKSFGVAAAYAVGRPLRESGIAWDWDKVGPWVAAVAAAAETSRMNEVRCPNGQGGEILLDLMINPVSRDRSEFALLGVEVTERKQMEMQLAQAQKLESIGQLAAGIAHEINTPIQFIGDNTRFVKDGIDSMRGLLDVYHELFMAARDERPLAEALAQADILRTEADVDYLNTEIPRAIEETLDGVRRIAKIVHAMKEFSHPGREAKQELDLNRAIESTIVVSGNEWKFVAEMRTDLDPELPPVLCFPGEINQTILNIIVNAAHAIRDVVGDAGGMGTISIATRRVDGDVEIRIGDTGTGIPEEIRSRIFDPFFTTKEVGKGTGQGLSQVHATIVKKHGGTVSVDSTVGKGTTFVIRVPIGTESAVAI